MLQRITGPLALTAVLAATPLAWAQGGFLGGMSGSGAKPAPAPEVEPPPEPAPMPAPPPPAASPPVASPPAATPPIKPDGSTGFVGSWRGVYTCAQGKTGVDIDITPPSGGTIGGIIHFYAMRGNPGVPSGSFSVSGAAPQPGDRYLSLYPEAWIERPPGYVMVGVDLEVTTDGKAMGGRITGAPGCTSVILSRL
jgi:hypothetical protein